ncbi:hypothetical protein JB92DRAFT_2829075 [Gautieria morchelliformis]|nr:hypothetical protein JB92DRAFT_2829075 [Gautieria morchelliformis]
MSMRNEVTLESARKSSSYMQMISRGWIETRWFRGCLLGLALTICPLGCPRSCNAPALALMWRLQEKHSIYDPHEEEGLRQHEGGQHAPLRHVFILRCAHRPRRGPTTTCNFEVSLEDRYKGAEINHYMLNIPVGVAEGSEFVFEGEGDESPDWEAGNVVIRVLGGKKGR